MLDFYLHQSFTVWYNTDCHEIWIACFSSFQAMWQITMLGNEYKMVKYLPFFFSAV